MTTRLILFLMPVVIAFPLYADESKPEKERQQASASDKQPEKEAPSVVELSGVFEAVRSTELVVENEQLTDLKLERIVAHGESVKKGAPIIWFETEELDDQVRSAEIDFKLATLQHEAEEFAYEQFIESQKLDRAAAKRTRDEARKDYDHYIKTQLDREIAGAQQSLKSAEFSVESAKEELNQLTQMYEEDDLTEQSEEIVLRRAKFSYESALHRLTDSKIRIKRSLKEMIPRNEARQKETLERALLAYDKSMHELDNARRKRDLEMERSRRAFAEKELDFKQLRKERNNMVIRAPHDGVVLHGKLQRGKLPSKAVQWLPGSKVAVESVIATLADPAKMQVRLDLPEEHLATAQAVKSVSVTAKGKPDVEFSAKVKRISDVPYVPGKFDFVVSVPKKKAAGVLPGMSCSVKMEQEAE